jgi:hypothetical protein
MKEEFNEDIVSLKNSPNQILRNEKQKLLKSTKN